MGGGRAGKGRSRRVLVGEACREMARKSSGKSRAHALSQRVPSFALECPDALPARLAYSALSKAASRRFRWRSVVDVSKVPFSAVRIARSSIARFGTLGTACVLLSRARHARVRSVLGSGFCSAREGASERHMARHVVKCIRLSQRTHAPVGRAPSVSGRLQKRDRKSRQPTDN